MSIAFDKHTAQILGKDTIQAEELINYGNNFKHIQKIKKKNLFDIFNQSIKLFSSSVLLHLILQQQQQ